MNLGLVPGTDRLSNPLNAIDNTVIQCAEFWADEFFNTPDGKQWRFLAGGESIFARNEEPLTTADRQWLDEQAGAIVDVSITEEKPLYFTDDAQLDAAWEELQRMYGVEADTYIPG